VVLVRIQFRNVELFSFSFHHFDNSGLKEIFDVGRILLNFHMVMLRPVLLDDMCSRRSHPKIHLSLKLIVHCAIDQKLKKDLEEKLSPLILVVDCFCQWVSPVCDAMKIFKVQN
jgi:hypothetical protein